MEQPEQQTEVEDVETSQEEVKTETPDFDLQAFGARFLPDLSILDTQDICPSLKAFELGNGDGSLDLPFLKAPRDWQQATGDDEAQNISMAEGLGGLDDDDDILGGFDMADAVGFGEGGEAWAKEVALEPQLRLHVMEGMDQGYASDGEGEIDGEGNDVARYAITMRHGATDEQQNILDYFDKALKSNWAGPEHWKIRKVKDTVQAQNQAPTKRKEKEPFEIDFLAPMSQQLADALYTPAPANSTISLPRAQWKSNTRNLLPDDKHFSSRQLLRLFLKPNASLSRKKIGGSMQPVQPINPADIDEQYWARQQQEGSKPEEGDNGNYDANFFQDDGFNAPGEMDDDDEDVFADARENFSPHPDALPGAEGAVERPSSQEGAFGAQIVTQSRRMRPEYVQYAKVAKKVDVRRLKEEIWKEMALEKVSMHAYFQHSFIRLLTNSSWLSLACLYHQWT